MIQGVFGAAIAVVPICTATSGIAQEKTGNKPGFNLPPGTVRIVLMRPAIRLGAQSTDGMFEPNADWATQARENIGQALKRTPSFRAKLSVPTRSATWVQAI